MRILRSRDGGATACWHGGRLRAVSLTPEGFRLGGEIGSQFPDELLSPVLPATVFGMAHNTGPADRALPPGAFLKAAASVSGPGDPIPLPDGIGLVEAEAELAAVIGTPLRHAGVEEVAAALLGFTVALDVTGRDAQRGDPLWTEAKSRTGFTPLGPWIETGLDIGSARIVLRVNETEVAAGGVGGLARSPFEAVAYLSTLVELRPGDVVLTGAPGTTAAIRPGDVVTAEVTGIGSLTCPVVRGSDG